MRRIFYYSSNGVKVFLWSQKKLLGLTEFSNDDSSREQFRQYLESSPQIDSQLLLDIIDEDFRRESIPHLNARDRKAMIQRLIDRHYRDEKYYRVQALGRSSEGRKDDYILLSSLSHFEKICPWIDIMKEQSVSLAGIWSVPHLTLDLLKLTKINSGNVLLVTRELPFSQRETFFKKGKMLFSRLERLDVNLYKNPDPTLSWECLTKGAEQIQHFLTNQRIITFTDKITVVCLVRPELLTATLSDNNDSQQLHYELIDEDKLFKNFSFLGTEPLQCDALFTWTCAQKNLFKYHYGEKEHKTDFLRYYFEKSFKSASYFVAIFLVSIAAFFWLSTLKTNKDIFNTQKKTEDLQQQYAQQFGGVESQLSDAQLVQSSVQQAKLIDIESRETPQKYFSNLSKIISNDRFKTLNINELYWEKHPRENIQQIIGQFVDLTSEEEDYDDDVYYGEDDTENTAAKYQTLLRLSGKLNREHLDYRNTVTVMLEFVASLENLSVVSDIHLIKTPVDIRPKSKFSDKSGTDQENITKNSEADRYEILMVIQPENENNS